MAEISPQIFCDAVYCAYAGHDALPSTAVPRVAFTAESTDGGVRQLLRVVFEGVHSITWTPPLPPEQTPYSCEECIEFSTVELEGETGAWRAWFDLWGTREFELRCSRVTLNGAEVVGKGRFIQDWLPAVRPVVPAYSPGAA